MKQARKENRSAPTLSQFETYQAIFDYWNKALFDGELSNCILNFSRRGKSNGGHFSPNRWEGLSTNGDAHEINLNPKSFKRGPKFVISIIVHEMAHLWHEDFGNPPKGGYHKKEWSEKMIKIGLWPVCATPSSKWYGGPMPESWEAAKKLKRKEIPSCQSMSHDFFDDGPFMKEFIKMPKHLYLPFESKEWSKAKAPGPEPSKNKSKYSCSCSNIWGKPNLEIYCKSCESDFLEQ